VWSVHFVAGLDGAGAELWIDDLALLCRGSCPAPVWDVHPTPVSGTDDRSLSWLAGDGTSPDTTCARIAPLSMAPPSNVPVDGAEKLLLRARVPVDPAPAVTIWAWVVENVATGARLDVAKIDESWATVAVPITEAGRYRVGAHTHYPASAVCGVSIEVEAR
jgi:hypothetical protein